MGSSLSLDRSYGSIFIQTVDNSYMAGEQVDGFIHLNLLRDFPSNVLYLIISGEEAVKLVSTSSHRDSKGRTHTQVHVHKDKNEFYGHTFPLFSQNTAYFPRGQYSFPFSFKLLESLPGTFRHSWYSHGHECYGDVTYKLWAGLKDKKKNKGVYDDFNLRVDQRYEHSNGIKTANFSKHMQAYCYKDIGDFTLTCTFQKDTFAIGETANILIGVDNSKGKVEVKKIRCKLIQIININTSSGYHSKTISRVCTELDLPGLLPGMVKMGDNAIPVMLPIRTNSENEATSNGTLVRNTFKLEIDTILDACFCCQSYPKNEIEIKIFNKAIAQPVNFEIPNWCPQMMNHYACTMSSDYRMTQEFKNDINITADVNYPIA